MSNRRMLLWNGMPNDGASADVVIGAADFTTVGSPAVTATTGTFFNPYIAGDSLFVVDSVNHRVVRFPAP